MRLSRAADRVRDARTGARNDTLNRCSYGAGRLVAAGKISERDAEAVLLDAAIHCGLARIEAAQTIRSGLRAGIGA